MFTNYYFGVRYFPTEWFPKEADYLWGTIIVRKQHYSTNIKPW